jgi:hypothetical protein
VFRASRRRFPTASIHSSNLIAHPLLCCARIAEINNANLSLKRQEFSVTYKPTPLSSRTRYADGGARE